MRVRRAASVVAEVHESTDRLDHLVGKVTNERWYDDLHVELRDKESDTAEQNKLTFMSAFESLPVHCLKFRPCGNRRRPGKGGTAAILLYVSTSSSM